MASWEFSRVAIEGPTPSLEALLEQLSIHTISIPANYVETKADFFFTEKKNC